MPHPAANAPLGVRQGLSNVTWRGPYHGADAIFQRPPPGLENADWFARRVAWSRLAADTLGLGPPVLGVDATTQTVVTRFVDGTTPQATPTTLAEVARAVCRLQASRAPTGHTFDAYAAIAEQMPGAVAAGLVEQGEADALLRHAGHIRAALARRGLPPVPCHNDLTFANTLEADGRLWIIDWECGGLNDPFFDLATLTAAESLGMAARAELLRHYLPQVTPADTLHLSFMVFITQLQCATWCAKQSLRRAAAAGHLACATRMLAGARQESSRHRAGQGSAIATSSDAMYS